MSTATRYLASVSATAPALAIAADEINAEHKAAESDIRSSVEHAIRCGQLLLKVKARTKHGDWEAWIADKLTFSVRAAQAYMQLASLDAAKAQRVADLTLREALKQIARTDRRQRRIEQQADREPAVTVGPIRTVGGELMPRNGAETISDAQLSKMEGKAQPGTRKPHSDPKDAKIARLEAELAESKALVESLKDDVERSLDASEVARDKAEACAELLETEPAKVLMTYKAEIRRLERYRDDLLSQNGQLVKQVRILERKLAKYEGAK